MAKIKYSYNVGGSKLKNDNRGKGKFFAVLFAVLLLIVLAIIFRSAIFGEKSKKAQESPVKITEEVITSQDKTTQNNVQDVQKNEADNADQAAPKTSADNSETQVAEITKNPPEYDQDLAKLNQAFAETDYQTSKKIALEMLEKYGEADKAGKNYREIGKFISKLNMKIINNGLTDEKMVIYRINAGDNLTNIAIKYNFPIEAIQKANNLKSTVIYPGKSLKVYKFDWRIEVSKKAKLLYVFDGDKLFSLYDIGIGKEGRTPEGDFKITDKIANPDWYSPDGRIVAFGDKENVLGTRWLKLEPINDTDAYHIGYGIHGTWDEGSITKSLSNGCIRMKNEEVEELFTYIPRQVIVKIY